MKPGRSIIVLFAACAVALALLTVASIVLTWQHVDRAAAARHVRMEQAADLAGLRTALAMQSWLGPAQTAAAMAGAVASGPAAIAAMAEVLPADVFETIAIAVGPGATLLSGRGTRPATDWIAGDPVALSLAAQARQGAGPVVSDPVTLDGLRLLAAFLPLRPVPGDADGGAGLAVVLVGLDRLLAGTGLGESGDGIRVAVRGVGRDGMPGALIVGDPALPEQAPAIREAHFPGGAWTIAAVAPPTDSLRDAVLRDTAPTIAGGAAVLVLVVLFLRSRGSQKAAIANARISADVAAIKLGDAQAQLRNALNTMTEGFAYFDRDDRLVICNERYRQMYAISADLIRPGARFEDIVRHGVAHGQYPDAASDPEGFVAERLRVHREARGRIELRLSDDRWMMVDEHRTPDGGIVGVRTDISELKRRSLEIEDQQILLRATLESLNDGVAVFDSGGQLVLWNSRFATLADIAPTALEPGIALAEVVSLQGEDGVLSADDVAFAVGAGHLDESRLALGRRACRSGRVVRLDLGWAAGSRTVLTLVDETEAEQAALALAASEHRLRGILEISPIGTVVLDREGHALFYNERYREMLGLADADMASYVAPSSFEDPEDLAYLRSALREHGVQASREIRVRRPDGAGFWVSLSARNVDFDGRKATIVHVFDITELKQVEEMLGEINKELEWRVRERVAERDRTLAELRAEMKRSQLLAAVIESSPSSITIADAQVDGLPLIYCNQAFTLMTGYTQADVVGRNCRFLAGPETDPAARQALRTALAEGRQIQVELVNYRKDGAKFLSQLTLFPVRGDGGEILHYVGTQRDVTEIRQAEADRAEMQARLAETTKFEALGTLAGGIAHEINTPSQYIGDNIRFLQTSIADLLPLALAAPDPGPVDLEFLAVEMPAAIDQCLEGIERVAQIVQAIKEFSHPSDKNVAAFDLNHAVESAVTVTRNQWKYVAELDLSLDPDLPLFTGNQGEINQVLLNTIVNAAHAIEERRTTEPGRIAVSTRLVGGEIELAIADSGVGIPADRREKIFEMFYTTKPPGKGTGQGLAITRTIIVQHHGGHIEVESTPGQGSTFRFLLPLDPTAMREAT
ncbi:MAG: PAS domain S-box protein [Alphaproteobacteria bacterium]|jgi:PAS domain S-box-containing protein|nr:PAS domain S-box protein [Alphaproteobacteria bacterium]